MVRRIHHINFLVRDLRSAVERYRGLLAADDFRFEDLPERGVKTARFKFSGKMMSLIGAEQ